MVLREEQFQRSEPTGCVLLTRQAPVSNMIGLRRGCVVIRFSCRPHHRSSHRLPWIETFGAGDARTRAPWHASCALCHGYIGEL